MHQDGMHDADMDRWHAQMPEEMKAQMTEQMEEQCDAMHASGGPMDGSMMQGGTGDGR
jgi:hypothetical protein